MGSNLQSNIQAWCISCQNLLIYILTCHDRFCRLHGDTNTQPCFGSAGAQDMTHPKNISIKSKQLDFYFAAKDVSRLIRAAFCSYTDESKSCPSWGSLGTHLLSHTETLWSHKNVWLGVRFSGAPLESWKLFKAVVAGSWCYCRVAGSALNRTFLVK